MNTRGPLIKAFRHSIKGIKFAAVTERAFRQEIVLCVVGMVVALAVADNVWKYVLLVGVIIATMTVELLNTALEKVCDKICPVQDETIGHIKDMGSGAVLLCLSLTFFVWAVAVFQYLSGRH